MNYSLEKLKKLREITRVGIKECINALIANDNNLEKSIEWIKIKSLVSSKSSKIDKISKFGLVKIKNFDNKIVAFSLKCESDFVAVNKTFIDISEKICDILNEKFEVLFNSSNFKSDLNEITKDLISEWSYSLKEKIYIEDIKLDLKSNEEVFGNYIHHNRKVGSFVIIENGNYRLAREISMQIVANNPKFLSRDSIPNDLFANKLEQINKEVLDEHEGKDDKIIEKISKGMIDKWVSEICFLEQRDFRNPSLRIKDIFNGSNSRIKKYLIISV